jgi:hypothetical protein
MFADEGASCQGECGNAAVAGSLAYYDGGFHFMRVLLGR